ncbi:MAG: archease [Methanomassiliicoccaceae archaeon]|nr:archease [Methanomassiliicoccaceae archaeon]
MNELPYETLEHTADILVKCTGDTPEECFESAAYALFDQMIDIRSVESKMRYRFEIQGDNAEDRLFAFLSELLFITDSESVVMGTFNVTFAGNKVICEAYGEPLDIVKHKAKAEIKAITYHMMSVNENEPSVTVLFDV